MADQEFLKKLHRDLLDSGKIIEAGWVSYRLVVMSPDAGAIQLEETRNAFFAGAQHLFGSIMVGLDDGVEETADDLARMEKIDTELQSFLEAFKRKHNLGD